LNDDVVYSRHNESDLGGISGAGKMGVDLLGLVLVQAHESVQNVIACRSIVLTSLVIWEIVLHWAHWELLLESIDLIQEQNDGRLDEPS